MSGIPFAKVDLKTIPGLCQPQATATPAPVRPTSSPPSVPLTPSAQTAPSDAISGYITVFGCKKPEYIKLNYCKDVDCKTNGSLRYNIPDERTPVPHGIWLEDTNADSTWIYRYSMTHMGDKPLDPTQSYRLIDATAVFNNNTMRLDSKAEDLALLTVKPGTRRDFQINAEKACSCQIKSVAYIKDTQGNIITSLDNQPGTYGLSNNFQYSQNKSRPASEFRNGRVTVGPGSYPELYDPKVYGPDTMAHSRLFAPGWKVLKQECVSRGLVNACPELAADYSRTADKLPHPELFEHLRVTCGVDLEYGWVLEKLPTPTPVVSPATRPASSTTTSDVFSNMTCPLRDDRTPSNLSLIHI